MSRRAGEQKGPGWPGSHLSPPGGSRELHPGPEPGSLCHRQHSQGFTERAGHPCQSPGETAPTGRTHRSHLRWGKGGAVAGKQPHGTPHPSRLLAAVTSRWQHIWGNSTALQEFPRAAEMGGGSPGDSCALAHPRPLRQGFRASGCPPLVHTPLPWQSPGGAHLAKACCRRVCFLVSRA